jgi:hypothetical protein
LTRASFLSNIKIGNVGNAAAHCAATITTDNDGIIWGISVRSDSNKEGQAFVRTVRTHDERFSSGMKKGEVRDAAGTWKKVRHSKPNKLLSHPVKVAACRHPIDGSLRVAVLTDHGVYRLENDPKSQILLAVSVHGQGPGIPKAVTSNDRYLAVMKWTESDPSTI